MEEQNPNHVLDIEKGKNEVIRIEISEFKGKRYLNLRVWYRDDKGDFKPTQKGISVAPELYERLRDGILLAGEKLEELE